MIVVQLATGDVLLLILQRYYFESESQLVGSSHCNIVAVAYPTKILFWKRITAALPTNSGAILLLLILQRYYFESESQLNSISISLSTSCCLSYKDTILKANHSSSLRFASSIALLLILQRYYFESESQRIAAVLGSASCCCLSYKDTILKANHS